MTLNTIFSADYRCKLVVTQLLMHVGMRAEKQVVFKLPFVVSLKSSYQGHPKASISDDNLN